MTTSLPVFSLRRVFVLASATFTQLVRMKILWFLAILVFLIGGLGFFSAALSHSPVQQLITLKSVALFVMGLFAELLAIAATAVLIPRDIEDRTLYTILCRPVPRIEYILGKFFGILALLAISLAALDLMLNATLWLRQGQVIEEQLLVYKVMGLAEDELAVERARLENLGVSWTLQIGVATIFMRAAIMAALTLLLSSIATSTLFTQVTAVTAYFIGHLVAMARSEAFLGDEWWLRTLVGIVAFLFPDLQLFNLNDALVRGEEISTGMLAQMSWMGIAYVVVYLLFAWLVFSEREY